MTTHELAVQAGADAIRDLLVRLNIDEPEEGSSVALTIARAVLLGAYPEVRSLAELDALPEGSAVRTSDVDDTVVLKDKAGFTNSCGADVPADVLWRYGTRPFHVMFRPASDIIEQGS